MVPPRCWAIDERPPHTTQQRRCRHSVTPERDRSLQVACTTREKMWGFVLDIHSHHARVAQGLRGKWMWHSRRRSGGGESVPFYKRIARPICHRHTSRDRLYIHGPENPTKVTFTVQMIIRSDSAQCSGSIADLDASSTYIYDSVVTNQPTNQPTVVSVVLVY
jgi:hypothetical protein